MISHEASPAYFVNQNTMAVSVESKTSTSQWTSIFPTETVTNVSESLKFMRKFAAVGVSTILYLRTNLPDDTFTVKNVDGMRVSIMTPNHRVTKAMCTSVSNGMKALKEGYLRELHILFHPNKETDDLVEMHRFSFSLPKDRSVGSSGDEGVSNNAVNDLIKKSTMKLLRTISANLQSFGSLPDSAAMSLRLIYDDEAPQDYNPPGFISCTPEELTNSFNGGEPTSFRMGSVATAWHKVEMDAMTNLDHLTQAMSQSNGNNEVEASPVYGSKSAEDNQETMMDIPPENEAEEAAEMSTIIALSSGLDLSQTANTLEANPGANTLEAHAEEKDAFEMTEISKETSKMSGPSKRGRGGKRGSSTRIQPYDVTKKPRGGKLSKKYSGV